jgi:hypothetical protein
MNRLNFNQSVGFPLETEILDEMQTSWIILNALGSIAGNFAILQGCIVVGTTVSDGTVFINGEVIEFKGTQVQDNVIIVETPTVLEFEDNSEHEVIYTRYATFGVATTQYPWSGFKRFKNAIELTEDKAEKTTIEALIKRIEELESRPAANVPVGLIAIWGQAANLIPKGWEEYTQLSGRVPVGLNSDDPDFDAILNSGGSKDAVLVQHNHKITNSGNVNDGQSGGNLGAKTARWDRGSGTLLNGDVSTEGESGVGKNMQPYRVVHFIKYVG